MFARHKQRTADACGKMRFAPQHLGFVQQAYVVDAVRSRLFGDAVQTRQIFARPGNDHRPGFQQRQVHPIANLDILAVPRLHACEFEASGRCVETGVQQRAIGFAGAGQDVGRLFQEHDTCTIQRKAPGHGAADDAAADDRYVE